MHELKTKDDMINDLASIMHEDQWMDEPITWMEKHAAGDDLLETYKSFEKAALEYSGETALHVYAMYVFDEGYDGKSIMNDMMDMAKSFVEYAFHERKPDEDQIRRFLSHVMAGFMYGPHADIHDKRHLLTILPHSLILKIHRHEYENDKQG